MKPVQKALLLIVLLASCLLLTGCYTEVDPWPSSITPDPTIPAEPATTVETTLEDAVDAPPGING